MDVSVIVPLYKGEKYVKKIISMLEENKRYLEKKTGSKRIEVILINDDPSEKIAEAEIYSPVISVTLLANRKNLGIHKSRIKGLEKAKGRFILFLDQDDTIVKEYFYKQLQMICDSDAVLCNGLYRENKLIYKNLQQQEKAVDKVYYYSQKTVIISPGQVLIRKEAIPDEWKNVCLLENGSDDVLLWILMLRNGSHIAVNPQCLYYHMESGDNASLDFHSMKRSVEELRQVVIDRRLLQGGELNTFLRAIEGRINKYESYNVLLDRWSAVICSLIETCKEKRYMKIAVYGYGVIGRKLVKGLEDAGIQIDFIIDQESECYKNISYKIYQPDMVTELADVTIITPLFDIKNIKDTLEKQDNLGKIYALSDFIG